MRKELMALTCYGLLMGCTEAVPAAAKARTETTAATPSTGPETGFQKANAVAMDRMMADMDVPPTGDVDRDFIRMMIPHHQGGVDMAEALLRYGENAELKALAHAIIDVQKKEIALMQRIEGELPPAAPAPAAVPPSHAGGHHHQH